MNLHLRLREARDYSEVDVATLGLVHHAPHSACDTVDIEEGVGDKHETLSFS